MALSYSPGEWGEEKPVDSKMQKYLDSVKAEFEEKSGFPTTMLQGISYRESKDNPGMFRVKLWPLDEFYIFNATIVVYDTGEVKLMNIHKVKTA